ncbi:MAG: hypothetical protein ACLVBP_09515 [Ruminococcus sp.]
MNKPGRLTAEEFAAIKGHSMADANMLSELPLEPEGGASCQDCIRDLPHGIMNRYDGGRISGWIKRGRNPCFSTGCGAS